MRPLKLVVCVVLALILCAIVCAHMSAPRAFALGGSKLAGGAFEGFDGMHPLEYTVFPTNTSIDSMLPNAITQSAGADRVKVSGFGGLLNSPSAKPETLDVFSQAQSKQDCKSYGLMGSNGFLCLNDDQIRLLRSRGGNLTGAEAQIG